MKTKKLEFDTYEKATIVVAVLSFFVFALLLKLSNMSVDRLVILQNQFLKVLFGGSAEFLSLSVVLQLLLAMVFLTVSLSLLSAYGARRDRYQIGLVSGIVSSIIFLVIFPTIISLFVAAAVVLSFSYTVMISGAYFNELKKWRMFRTGSAAVGKALLIINLIVAAGILTTITLDSGHYKAIFKEDLTNTITAATLGTVKTDSPVMQEQIKKRVAELVDTSSLFQSYIKWLPILTAFSIWIAMEFLRSLVFSNIAGLFTALLLRYKK